MLATCFIGQTDGLIRKKRRTLVEVDVQMA